MSSSKIRIYSENEVILREGISNKEMFKIVSGTVAVYFDYGKETEYLVGLLSEGRCFCDIGLLTGKPSPFTVVAFNDLMLLGIEAEDFRDFITEEPDKAIDIMKSLAGTVVTMSANVNMLKDEMLETIDDQSKVRKENELNKSILKYRVSGLQGSTYFSRLS